MENLLQSQIKECYKLSLPVGLKDLMSDISREVLRAQPPNLYQFIADYLSALLVARENLTIACSLCKNICAGTCYPELEDELRFIGLENEDAEIAKDVIMEYFAGGGANEANLMYQIAKSVSLPEDQLSAIQHAVRAAFQRHLINNTTLYETSSDSDDVSRAAKHTLELYRKTKHSPAEYDKMATNIQKTYKAYGVRRPKCPNQEILPPAEKLPEKTLRFSVDVYSPPTSGSSVPAKPCFLRTVSSTSLAGSYLNLPKYRPYSVHDLPVLDNLDESPEKENTNIDYTNEDATASSKSISFHNIPHEIEDDAVLADDESDESVEMCHEPDNHEIEATYEESEVEVKDESENLNNDN